MIVIISMLFTVLIMIQIFLCVRKKYYKELIVSIVIICIALIWSYSQLLNWNIPSPNTVITIIYKPVSEFIYGKTG